MSNVLSSLTLECGSKLTSPPPKHCFEEFYDYVIRLWSDPGVQRTFLRMNEFLPIDSAKYFLDQVHTIRKKDYMPSDQDILHCRKRTTDIQRIEFGVKVPKKYGGGYQTFWFKIESGFRVNDESNDSTNACSVTSNLNFKKLIPDFDPKLSDISLYLVIFERQAKRASIEKKEWVGQLLGLLPLEIVQFIAREPEEQAENYDYVKKLLLKRFKLSPEVFRQKFVQHQKKSDSTWKDFTFEITNYLDEWLIGL
ncbi:guanine nucleotide-binding protein G(S) subunit alpha [Trichonephila clavipes]|nr:guanine nucleotide-binding protein G(S) subunit alpha [Trichonephila clavipes]